MSSSAERISLRKLDPGRYYCDDLGIIIEKERIGGAYGPARTEWGMTAGDCFVSAPTLGACQGFLNAIYERAAQKAATGRTKAQAKLTKVERDHWRTADGIEVRCEPRPGKLGSRFDVELTPGDPFTRSTVGINLEAAKRYIANIPWRGSES